MGFTHKTHGMKSHKLYAVYQNMIARCYIDRPWNADHFRCYGARGIKVCDAWKNNSASFFEWALASGYRAGLHLDRRDNDGNYTPDNCRWVSTKVSARNKQKPAIVLTLSDAAVIKDLALRGIPQKLIGALYGVHHATVSSIKLGINWKDANSLTADFYL